MQPLAKSTAAMRHWAHHDQHMSSPRSQTVPTKALAASVTRAALERARAEREAPMNGFEQRQKAMALVFSQAFDGCLKHMCICIYIYIYTVYVCVCVCVCDVYTCIYVCTHMYVHVYVPADLIRRGHR